MKQIREDILPLFEYLSRRNYSQAEKRLFLLMENAFRDPKSKTALHTIELIYRQFNRNYLEWVKDNGGNVKKEIEELSAEIHENFLLAHCSDPASVDDLIYELIQYIKSNASADLKKEVDYHFQCYRKLLNC